MSSLTEISDVCETEVRRLSGIASVCGLTLPFSLMFDVILPVLSKSAVANSQQVEKAGAQKVT
jgi:hypothetical protein